MLNAIIVAVSRTSAVSVTKTHYQIERVSSPIKHPQIHSYPALDVPCMQLPF